MPRHTPVYIAGNFRGWYRIREIHGENFCGLLGATIISGCDHHFAEKTFADTTKFAKVFPLESFLLLIRYVCYKHVWVVVPKKYTYKDSRDINRQGASLQCISRRIFNFSSGSMAETDITSTTWTCIYCTCCCIINVQMLYCISQIKFM